MESDSLVTLTIVAVSLILGWLAFFVKWETREEREQREFLEWQAKQKLFDPMDNQGGMS